MSLQLTGYARLEFVKLEMRECVFGSALSLWASRYGN